MRILGFVVHDKACFCGWKDQNLGSVHENAYFCGRDVEKYRFCPEIADSVVQAWCKCEKEKCKCLKIKHLHFVGYPEPGSNRHGLLHWCLRPARLPIPPSGLVALRAVPQLRKWPLAKPEGSTFWLRVAKILQIVLIINFFALNAGGVP